ncbi:MAG: lytic transglycosylase domain-containing protein [Desulfobacterales bacterium]|nr:MAG: lytic transglycosylase domain-containing protein [Desulfobacterales bacterium]
MPAPAGSKSSPEAPPAGDRPTANLRPGPRLPTEISPPAPGRSEAVLIERSIERAAAQYQLPPALLTAVVRAESDFKVTAVSPAGAQGLMQLMPATARELGVNDPFDIEQNINGGARYLRQMLDRFDGDLRLALAAYNAGPGTVKKFGGDVPYPETRLYVERVLRFAGQAA